MKYLFTLMALLIGLMFYLIIEDVRLKRRCIDAGGVPSASVCVNPSAVIEVD
jgi:hypothetical protein